MKSYKILARACLLTALVTIIAISLSACAPAADSGKLKEVTSPAFTLTILHINDTHSYVVPHDVMMNLNGMKTLASAGGYSLLDSAVGDVRNKEKNVLLLHGGDILDGTIWSSRFNGMADADAMNAIGFDAFVPGNHEFSLSVQEAANLFNRAKFPVVAANMDVSLEPLLAGKVQPYVIVQFDDNQVGIIGLANPDTAFLSYPGKNIIFLDPAESARRCIAELNGRGINKVIILSHLGYPADVALAKAVPGIDIIVGGHTGTLMGGPEFEQLGIKPETAYPTDLAGPGGDKVLVVQAGEYNYVLGDIKLSFDEKGKITGYSGQPFIFSTNGFKIEDAWGWSHLCGCRPEYTQIMDAVANNPAFRLYWNSPDIDNILQPYLNQVSTELYAVVAIADENLLRGTNSGPGPIIADAFLQAARKFNPGVQFAIYDTYNIRSDIYKGNITANDVYMLLPLRQNLVTLNVKGSILKTLLEMGLDSHVKIGDLPPCYEVAGLKLTVDMNRKSSDRITALQVRQADGTFKDMDANAEYVMATTDYLADKGIQPLVNKVSWMGAGADVIKSWIRDYLGYRPLGIKDVEAMSDYLRALKNVRNFTEERTTVIPAAK